MALPARDDDPCGTHRADLVGVAQAEMGRLAASDVTEEVTRAVWTSLLALLLPHPCHVSAGITIGRLLLYEEKGGMRCPLWFPERDECGGVDFT